MCQTRSSLWQSWQKSHIIRKRWATLVLLVPSLSGSWLFGVMVVRHQQLKTLLQRVEHVLVGLCCYCTPDLGWRALDGDVTQHGNLVQVYDLDLQKTCHIQYCSFVYVIKSPSVSHLIGNQMHKLFWWNTVRIQPIPLVTPLNYCDCRFESYWGHGCLYPVVVVYCIATNLCNKLITHWEKFYQVCMSNRVWSRNFKTSQPWPSLGCSSTEERKERRRRKIESILRASGLLECVVFW